MTSDSPYRAGLLGELSEGTDVTVELAMHIVLTPRILANTGVPTLMERSKSSPCPYVVLLGKRHVKLAITRQTALQALWRGSWWLVADEGPAGKSREVAGGAGPCRSGEAA